MRTWKCNDCGRTVDIRYEEVLDIGTPMCECAGDAKDMELLPASRIRLAVVLEGGMVSSICSDHPELLNQIYVITIDYDTDGADEDEITLVPQGGIRSEPAIVSRGTIDPTEIKLDELFKDNS